MSEKLSERQVLDQLDIPDFGHMSKDKIIKFAALMEHMSPEVAAKAIEQFPDFSKTVIQLATEYKETINKGMEANSKNMEDYTNMLQSIIDALQRQLDNDNMPFEERKYYIDKMFEISERMAQKDTENKEFISKVVKMACGTALALVAVCIVALGGQPGSGKKYENDEKGIF